MTISDRHRREPRARTTDRRAKVITGILLMLGLFAGFIGLAPVASAHHPQMAASAACGPTPGTYVITVSAKPWTGGTTDQMTHEDVDIYWGPTSVTWPASAADAPTGANAAVVYERNGVALVPTDDGGTFENLADTANDYRFTAKFDVTTTDPTIEVIAHADGGWGVANNRAGNEWRGVEDGAGGNGTPAVVTLPTDCEEPNLQLGPIVECVQGGISVTIINSGTGPGDATVTYAINGGAPQIVGLDDVPAGPVGLTRFIAIPENAGYTLSFAGDFGVTPEPVSDTLDCLDPAAPGATVAWECGDEAAEVVLTNGGDETITATIFKEGVAVPGLTDLPVTPAGRTEQVPLDAVEGDEVVISVTFSDAGAATDVSETFSVDCEDPAYDVDQVPVCAEGGLTVVLTNDGPSATTVTIWSGDDLADTVVVPGAVDGVPGSAEGFVPVAEDSTVTITIKAGDVTIVVDELSRDCTDAELSDFSIECAEATILVTLTNGGDEADTVDVSKNGVLVAADVPVPAGGTTISVPLVDADEDANVVIGLDFADGVDTAITVPVNCLESSAELESEVVCARGGLDLELRNTGTDTAEYTVASLALPGGATTQSVEAGGVATVLIPLAEDASSDVTVTSGDETLLDTTITRDCEAVEGRTIAVGSSSLPRTGGNPTGPLALAGALLLAGAAMIAGARRRRVEGLS